MTSEKTSAPAPRPHPVETRTRQLRAMLARLRKRLPLRHRLEGGLAHGLMCAVASLLAYLPTQALGLREGFWAAITAIAVVQTEFGATRSTARDQFTGASVGGVMGVGVVFALGSHPLSYALAVILAVLTCWLLNVASAARLAGITATIILIVPHAGSAQSMMLSRVLEVGWGVSVAVTVVWVITWMGQRLRPRSRADS